MSFSPTKPPAPSEPWRPGMYSLDVIKAHEGFDALPERYPGGEQRIGLHSLPAAAPPPSKASPPIRATRKAAQWREGVYRAWGYLACRVREPSEAAKLGELLEQTLAAGPDFAKVRRNATFAPISIGVYSKDVACEILRQAREIERETYPSRVKGEHGGALGRTALDLLEWFAFVMWPKSGRFGMVPSIEHIAAGARMSRSTVVAAMKKLEAFGLLTIQRRRKVVQTPFGAKVVQDTNGYVLSLAKGLGALALLIFGNNPPVTDVKPSGFSEFARTPAIRTEHYSPMAKPQEWFPKPEYEPLLT